MSSPPRKISKLDDDRIPNANDLLISGRNYLILGAAGTGKTHLLLELQKLVPAEERAIVCPAAKAGANAGGLTIHSVFDLNYITIANQREISTIVNAWKPSKNSVLANLKYLFVDEISMVSNKLFDIMDKILQRVHSNNKPFGGLTVFLFGDFRQLPPISIGLYSIHGSRNNVGYSFLSESWPQLNLNTILLEKNFRQRDDTQFLNLLGEIRNCSLSLASARMLFRRMCFGQAKHTAAHLTPSPIYLFGLNAQADCINSLVYARLKQNEHIFTAKVKICNKNDELINEVPSQAMISMAYKHIKSIGMEPQIPLKIGLPIMVRVNCKDLGCFNGDCGVITEISTNNITFKNSKSGKTFTLNRYSFKIPFNEHKNVIIEQLPLRHGSAITTHKAQGETINLPLVLDLSKKHCFEPYMFYVALSRATCLDNVYLDNLELGAISTSQIVENFYDKLNKDKKSIDANYVPVKKFLSFKMIFF